MKPGPSYSIDFHVHTWHSFDSLTPPRALIETARRRGLDGIAVVDHENVRGALATVACNPYDDFLVIPGIEVKSDRGDVVGLFVRDDIRSRRFEDVIAEILARGGVPCLPHPLRTFKAVALDHIHADHPELALWELYNGRYGEKEFADARIFVEPLGIDGLLAGSDAHFPWEIGICRTILPELPRDAASLRALVSQATFESKTAGELRLRFGLRLGGLVKAFKRGEYARAANLMATLPWRFLRRLRARAAGAERP
jgi:predicted metal-dependent phosphoesterase TrpH